MRLSAFADEISPDLQEQIAVLRAEGIGHVELRSVWNTNVLDLSDAQVTEIRRAFGEAGIRVSAIGSPIGKVPIDEPFEPHLARFERALDLAGEFETPFIRLFSFYPPAADPATSPASYRDEVLRRLRAMTDLAAERGITLLHENEREIYGDTIARCVDLLASIRDERFAAILDPANFIQCGQTPYPDAYEAIKDRLRYVHVKDARPDGTVTVAGEGAARWPDLLRTLHADGFDGFFSLEPHLAAAGRFAGFSGPDLFRQAARAFRVLLQEMQWRPKGQGS
jgi:sugar phosphate isomerase/epimerase